MAAKQITEEEVVLTPGAQAKIDELNRKLAEMEAQVKAKDQHIVAQEKKIEKLTSRGAGWLVTTPNPMYDGLTYGVQFVNGQAFIAQDRVIHSFVLPQLKETQLAKLNEKERETYEQRSKLPSAQLCAEAMESNFGYQIAYFDGTDDKKLGTLISERAKERAEAQRVLDEMGMSHEGLVQPSRAGVVR